eukprot:637918_1
MGELTGKKTLNSSQQTIIIQYVMSFEEIKNECVSNMEMLWRIVYWMNQSKCDQALVKYMVSTLNLNEQKVKELQSFQCPKPITDHYFTYWDKKIPDEAWIKLLK